jgi:tyrosyl-tRNA synthetase
VSPDEQVAWLTRNAVQVYSAEELRQRLAEGRPLRVKLGVDPTAPDIHLGHTIGFQKLREFQELGHQAVVIIGDFTARIGDPSGRSATRKQLTAEEVEAHAATYLEQIFKIVDPERTDVVRNSAWFGAMPFDEVVRLAAHLTVARMIERDDFAKRLREGTPVGLHELLYPLMQGWDSVVVRADVELGGTDQIFNLLVGRDLQSAHGMPRQIALALPLLEGVDGGRKMSKSYGNQIGVADAPADMFGKVMSISDGLMLRYYALLSDLPEAEQEAIRTGAVHPMDAKKQLAAEIVARFHGRAAAEDATRFFEERFQRRTSHAPERVTLSPGSGAVGICELLKLAGFAASSSEARRLVVQRGVRVDGEVVGLDFQFHPGQHRLLGVGRRRLAEVVRSDA